MSAFTWFQGRSRRIRRRDARQSRTVSLNVETLEDRNLPSLVAPVSYPVAAVGAVVSGDFNGDGAADLATVDGNSVSVLLGNGAGGFQAARTTTTSIGARWVEAGDFNRDGRTDLVTANASDMAVMLANNDGTFQTPLRFGIGSNPLTIAVGHFDADGILDLGVTSSLTSVGYATILRGRGDGSFAAGFGKPLSTIASYWAGAGDVNNDGKLDLVVAGSVTVLLGNGDGTLQPPIDTGIYPSGPIAAGDVDGDGRLDLVSVANVTPGGNVLYKIIVRRGNGNGTFAPPIYSPWSGYDPGSLVLADINGDHLSDILMTCNGWTDPWDGAGIFIRIVRSTDLPVLAISLSKGDMTYSNLSTCPLHVGYTTWFGSLIGIAPADFNRDGVMDVAVAKDIPAEVAFLKSDGAWPAPDAPAVTINDVTMDEGNIGTTDAVFTVSLSAAYYQQVTVDYVTADGTAKVADNDYLPVSGTLIFQPGETTKTIRVPVVGDRLGESPFEGNPRWDTFFVNLTKATNAFLRFNDFDDSEIGRFDARGQAYIADDELRVTISHLWISEGNTGTRTALFTVEATGAYDVPVSIPYATVNGTATTADHDYVAASGTVTFIPGGPTTQTIPVTIIGDRRGEPDENFYVNLAAGPGASLVSAQATGSIVDDEPRISVNDVTKKEANAKTTLFVFTVTLSAAYDVPVTVNFATANGTATVADSDYSANSGTLTFAPGETTKTITIVVKADKRKEANETFFVDLSGANGAYVLDSQGLGTILNDDR